MKTIERYLCARCWLDVASAGLECYTNQERQNEKKPCDWCGRSCYGSTYRITYGRGRKE